MIDKISYILGENNYIPIETDKKRIVIGNSFSVDMNHYVGWKSRHNGKFKRTAPYTISMSGEIYEHYNPKYYSEIINDEIFNKTTIPIIIENEGWLIKDLNEENRYITHLGNIYNRIDKVFIKKWRGNNYWAPYTDEQLNSLVDLTKSLCEQFNIPKNVIHHNTKINDAHIYDGILYKSNLNTHFTDVNPSWDFISFKNKIEENY
jgi:hypothetical protein